MTRFVLVLALFLSCLAGVADAATVRMFTVLGEIDVELDYSAPVTCANFLRYVNEGAYDYSLFHRSVQENPDAPGDIQVFQGGGIQWNLADDNLYWISTHDPIVNEFSPERSNVYGTIAMARQGGVVDSATSQFYFNMADNVVLDSIDEGFTVFGNVIGGMDVLVALHSLDVWAFQSPFGELPAQDTFTAEDYNNGYSPYLEEMVWLEVAMLLADADGDGVVGAADYIALKHNFGTESGATWEQGDFDGDGDVDFDDKTILEFSYGQGPIVTEAPEQSTSVPEPATLFAMMTAGLPAFLKRRRSRVQTKGRRSRS